MKLLLLAMTTILFVGCGNQTNLENNSVTPDQIQANVDRVMQISIGLIQPTQADLLQLDIAPVINGVSSPDGVIDICDGLIWLQKLHGDN